MPQVYRIDFSRSSSAVPVETFASQAKTCVRERTPRQEPNGRKLAICGGGPLLVHDLKELRAWDGDIWGINHTARWLCDRGINAALYTIDALPFDGDFAVASAVIASSCHESLFEGLKDSNVKVFDIHCATEKGLPIGTSSGTSTPWVALHFGYRDVSVFGCEGSFVTADHVDRDDKPTLLLIVRANGKDYQVQPPMLIQCLEFARIFREVPDVFTNRSRGLLRAILADPEGWSVVAVSEAMREHLKTVNGETIYNVPWGQT